MGLFVVSLVALVGLQTLCFWCFVSGLVGSFGLEDFEISDFRMYFSQFRWIVDSFTCTSMKNIFGWGGEKGASSKAVHCWGELRFCF